MSDQLKPSTRQPVSLPDDEKAVSSAAVLSTIDTAGVGSTRQASEEEALLCSLVSAIASGDGVALCALYKITVPLLFALARKVVSNSADAEEVICDVYTQVWQTAAQYDIARGPVRAWLITICRSRALDRRRQERCRPQIAVAHDANSAVFVQENAGPEDALGVVQEGSRMQSAIFRLSPVRRQLLELAFFQGLSHCEIAGVTGIALGTVKSHLRRSLAALREDLESKATDAPPRLR